MPTSTISYKLNLVIQLLDATTGKLITSPTVHMYIKKENGFELTYPMRKDAATYIYINSEKENARYKVEAAGFRSQEFEVNYEELLEDNPIREVFLIPEPDSFTTGSFLTVSGKIKGLTYLAALNTKDIISHAERYDAKRVCLHTFENASLLGVGGSPYGVLRQEDLTFEEFFTDGSKGSNVVKLRRGLNQEVVRNSPVASVIMGQVDADGSYILRIRKKMNVQRNYIFKYIVNGEVLYKQVDFTESEEDEWSL